MKEYKRIIFPIKQYFYTYYETLKTGNYLNASNYFYLNDYTVIPQRLLINKQKLYKAFNLRFKDYHVKLEFAKIHVNRNRAIVIVIENSDYIYNNLANHIISKSGNIEYYIELKKINGRWKITYMDSDDDEYIMANDKSNQYIEKFQISSNNRLTHKGNALNKVFDDLDEGIDGLKNLAKNSEKEDVKGEIGHYSVDTYSAAYPYHSSNGINYARRYALYDDLPDAEKLFYYASNGSDCANFVSQCVWAAYGGYVDKDVKQTKQNIAKKVRMVFTGYLNTSWYATEPHGGGTPYWENVNHFFEYVTANKSVGPIGKTYGGVKQSEFNFNKVLPGNVLQFWPEHKDTWYHSCYVSEVYTVGKIDQIYVCQHSMNRKDRPLIEILVWNTNNGHIRGISFNAAVFSK